MSGDVTVFEQEKTKSGEFIALNLLRTQLL